MSSSSAADDGSLTRKRVLLTGASGYLGHHLLYGWISQSLSGDNRSNVSETNDTALGSSMEIFAAAQSPGFDELVQPVLSNAGSNSNRIQVQVVYLDITDQAAVGTWIEQHVPLSICVHTAAWSSPGACEEQPELAHQVNVPVHLFQCLAKHSIPIVALSTDQVYDGTKPSVSLSTFYTEQDAPNPLNEYGRSKVAMEQALMRVCPQAHVSLRSSIILGPLAPLGGSRVHSTFLHFCASRQEQETDFYTDECRTVVSVRDVQIIVQWFLDHPPNANTSGIYNMGGSDRVSRFDMAKATFDYLGYDTKYLKSSCKSTLPPGSGGKVKSPMDISMNSTKLAELIGREKWKGLSEIIQDTFSNKN